MNNVRVGKRKRCQPAMIERKYSVYQGRILKVGSFFLLVIFLLARTWQLWQQLVVCPSPWVISPCHWFLAGCIGRAWKFRTRVNYFRALIAGRRWCSYGRCLVMVRRCRIAEGGTTTETKKGAWWEADVASQKEEILVSSPLHQAPSCPSFSPTSTFFATIII